MLEVFGFFRPIFIGNFVEIRARLVHTGSSSMHIMVDVFSKKLQDAKFVKNTHCMIIFVAMGIDGHSVNVPPFIPSSVQEKRLQEYVVRLMNLRKDIEKEMKEFY